MCPNAIKVTVNLRIPILFFEKDAREASFIYYGNLQHAIEVLLSTATKDKLDEICDFIEDPTGSDVAWRDIDNNERIIFAGERSWGDEPYGYGYSLIKDLYSLQLERLLRVR